MVFDMSIEKSLYRKLMLETSKQISPLLINFLKPLKRENPELYKTCIELIAKRKNKFMVRGYLARFSYAAISSKGWKNILYFCAATEMELASMYYSNRIFDKKGGQEILRLPNNQFIASMLTRDTALQMFSNVYKNISMGNYTKIRNLFDKSNKECYIGQFIDMNMAVYSSNLKLEEKSLTDLYIRRCYGINAHYFEAIGKIGAILANGNENQIRAMGEFGKNYGIALQIVNDIADFVPAKWGLGTSEKLPEDAYADLLQGKLTYPIIYTLLHGKEPDKKFLIKALKNQINKRELIKITKMFAQNGAFSESKRLARHYVKKAHSAIQMFKTEKRRHSL